MAYTNAIFYMDYVNGSDSARSDLAPTAYANNGSGLVRVTTGATGAYATGLIVDIAGTTGAVYDGAWKVTVIDGTHIDLQGSTFSSNPVAKGTCTPRGGSSWTDAWKTISSSGASSSRIAVGDIIRLAKSPAPTSLGTTGQWTGGGKIPATVTPTSSTNATPIVVTKNAHGLSNGDVVQVLNHATNTNANGNWIVANVATNTFELQGSVGNGVGGATGTYQKINVKAVVLGTAQNATIDTCDVVWTAAAGGDTTPSLVAVATDGKEGPSCLKILLDSAVQTSILQAYHAMSSTDFSAYQKISFWIKNSAAIAANNFTLTLCSDNAGATPVDTFAIPAIPAGTGQWIPMTIARNGGGNCGATIQSIAINTGSVAPTNSSNILLDNIIACTTSGLNLTSLISKNSAEQGGTEGWYGIQSIKGTIVLLDNDTNCKGNAGRGYSGATEAVTTYIRGTIPTTVVGTVASVQATQRSGNVASGNIQYQGGYNTSNSAQDGETFFDGQNGFGHGLQVEHNYNTFNYLNFVRYQRGIDVGTASNGNCNTFQTLSNLNNNTIGGLWIGGGLAVYNNTFNTVSNCNNNGPNAGQAGIMFNTGSNNIIKTLSNCNNNLADGICFGNSAAQSYLVQNNTILSAPNVLNNGLVGIDFQFASGNKIWSLTTAANDTAGINNVSGVNYVKSWVTTDTTAVATNTNFQNSRLYCTNFQGGVDHRIYTDNGQIDSAATDRAGGTGKMWKEAITANVRDVNYPMWISVSKMAVVANKAVTITAYMKKDHATNINAHIVVKGGQLAGVATDVQADASSADTNWHQITLADFTPTELGVVELLFTSEFVAGASNAYIGEITVTQAS